MEKADADAIKIPKEEEEFWDDVYGPDANNFDKENASPRNYFGNKLDNSDKTVDKMAK